MKYQHTFQIKGKSYMFEEPMTTDCGEMFIRLQAIILPAIGASESGYKEIFTTLFSRLPPSEFVGITQTLVSWCHDDKGNDLAYNTEFRGADGMQRLLKLCESVLKALYSDAFKDLKEGVMAQYKNVLKARIKAIQQAKDEVEKEQASSTGKPSGS